MKSHDIATIVMFLMGGFGCIFCNRPDLAALGVMLVAGMLRIAWGYENRELEVLSDRVDALIAERGQHENA